MACGRAVRHNRACNDSIIAAADIVRKPLCVIQAQTRQPRGLCGTRRVSHSPREERDESAQRPHLSEPQRAILRIASGLVAPPTAVPAPRQGRYRPAVAGLRADRPAPGPEALAARSAAAALRAVALREGGVAAVPCLGISLGRAQRLPNRADRRLRAAHAAQ